MTSSLGGKSFPDVHYASFLLSNAERKINDVMTTKHSWNEYMENIFFLARDDGVMETFRVNIQAQSSMCV